jgi:hypothetical protein
MADSDRIDSPEEKSLSSETSTWGMKDIVFKEENEEKPAAGKSKATKSKSKAKSKSKSGKKPTSDIQAFATELKEGELPDGWRTEKRVRQNGNTAGTSDTYYVSPDGRKCRSMIEVAKYLAGGSSALTRPNASARSSSKKAKNGASKTKRRRSKEPESDDEDDGEDDAVEAAKEKKASPVALVAPAGARRSGRASKQIKRFEAISSTAHIDRLHQQGLLTNNSNEGLKLKSSPSSSGTRKSRPKSTPKAKSLKARHFDTVYPNVWETLGFQMAQEKKGRGRKTKATDGEDGQGPKKKRVVDDSTILRVVPDKQSKKEYINDRVRLVDGKPVLEAIGTMVPKFKQGMIQQVRYTRGDLYYDLSHGLLVEEGGRAGRWKNVKQKVEDEEGMEGGEGEDTMQEADMDWEDFEDDEAVSTAAPDLTKYSYTTGLQHADCVHHIAMVSKERYGRTKEDQRLIILTFNPSEEQKSTKGEVKGEVVAHFEIYNITQHAAMDWECTDLLPWVTNEMASAEEVEKAKEVCVPDPLEGVFKMYDSDEEFDEAHRKKAFKKKRQRQQQQKREGGKSNAKKEKRKEPKVPTATNGKNRSAKLLEEGSIIVAAAAKSTMMSVGAPTKRDDKSQLYAKILAKKGQKKHAHMQKAETVDIKPMLIAKPGAAMYPVVWASLGFKDTGPVPSALMFSSVVEATSSKNGQSNGMVDAEQDGAPAARLRRRRSSGVGTGKGEDLTTFTIIQHRILKLLPQTFDQHDEICSHCYDVKGQREEVEGEEVLACSFCNEVYHPALECLGPDHFPVSKHESSWGGNDEWCCPKCFKDARSKYARRFFDNYDDDENGYEYSSDEDDDWQCLGYGGIGAPVNQTHNVKHDIPLTMLPPHCHGGYVARRQEKGEDVDDKEYKKEKEEAEKKAAAEAAKESPKKRKAKKAMPPAQLLPSLDYDLIFEALERVSIPVNESRFNVKINAQQELLGMCIGCVNGRSRGVIASVHTYRLRYLSTLLVEFGRRALPPDFHFTSIQVNKNYLSAMHVDKGNVGPSYIVGVGDFKGGKLWVHRQKYALRKDIAAQGYTPEGLAASMTASTDGTVRGWDMPWDDKIRGKAECFPVKNKWELFDGNMPHCTLPYAGTRYTFIYFTQRSHHKIDHESKKFLETEIGFPYPPPTMQKPPYPKQVARLNAAVDVFAKWKASNPDEVKPIGTGGEHAGELGMEDVGRLPPTATSTGNIRTVVRKVEETALKRMKASSPKKR